MTLPLPELDVEPDAEPELSRVTVLVGTTMVDVGLPLYLSIGAIVNAVIDLAAEHSPAGAPPVTRDGNRFTFAKIGGAPIDPSRSLAEAGIHDGDILVLAQVGAPFQPVLFDDVNWPIAAAPRDARQWISAHAARAGWFGASLVAAVTAVMLGALRSAPGPAAGMIALAAGIGWATAACILGRRGSTSSGWLGSISLPLMFGGSLYVVPGGHGLTSLPMAIGVTALAALLMLLITRRARPLYTAVIAAAALCGPAALVSLLWQASPRALGAALATAAVIVVYLSPRATIVLSRLPIPRVPTAGEPLDDIDTAGGTTVDGVDAVGKQVIPTEEDMTDQVRRANEYLSGILVASAAAALVGCYLVVHAAVGFFWQGTAFAVTVAVVLCLRGRSHHDLVQSATLIAAGLLVVLVAILADATAVGGWRMPAALALVMLTALVLGCGLVAPRLDFSPVQRRLVEIVEYLAIALVFPLAFWIMGAYAYFRELHL
ncbi:type VII secretion integral membrane protein EccD [Mycolicibacterium sp. CBMA 226]|uniref:type VII secretion integral membrane protein EccD n=1 Tax=Mycolicibacterium sp. CBMA 226 TaxID=2606611 RepID=UPI0012DCCB07|nr:type VII secretion integral membrane protein EccD [Mycolicibacterium sp. CBMA 226]MUL78861.1 type VII secretion integral membrane protein EccD [Mycolicibacterium sp. CBMA 226]QGW61158.1 ESX-5 secretion system protein EccD5 [Mycolicibacterium sp.]